MSTGNDYVTSKQFEEFVRDQKQAHARSEEAAEARGEQISDIVRKMDSIDRWRVRSELLVNKHEHTLYGNGEPGMDEMMRELYAWMRKRKDREEDLASLAWAEIRKYLFWLITFLAALWLTGVFSK